jgi:alkaline phosphatase
LIEKWKASKKETYNYVWNSEQLSKVNTEDTNFLLGLFEADVMKYNLENDKTNPTLTDMTQTAIKMLQKEENGYFLFISHGLIDKAHHKNYAQLALDETKQFSEAIEMARNLTSEEDTLIVVTANHAQTFVYNGYPVFF